MIFFSSPYLIPNPTRSFDHNWDFPKAFWKESRRLLIAAVLSLTAAEVARPFAVYHMESNTALFMASPDDTTVGGDWKPSSIYQLYGRRSELRRPEIIAAIYLKVVGLKERKAVPSWVRLREATQSGTASNGRAINFRRFSEKRKYRRIGIGSSRHFISNIEAL